MSDDPVIAEKARDLVTHYAKLGLTIATAESCTGGLIAGAITDVPGSSAVLDRGFVTYSNRAKSEMIGVQPATIDIYGAVSRQVAADMAEGARKIAGVSVAVAVTGIAGPGGGSPRKPVGLVHFACAHVGGTTLREERFGDLERTEIRRETVIVALDMLLAAADPD